MTEPGHDITRILQRLAAGDGTASNELLTLVYAQLHSMAQVQFRRSNDGTQTLQPTALVSEAYLKLFGNQPPNFKNREHFMAVAAKAMRSVLVDRARARGTVKRGNDPTRVSLDPILVPFEDNVDVSMIDLDDALERLALRSPLAAEVVEQRFFGGLGLNEIASVLGISLGDVHRNWRTARAWLRRELDPDRGLPHDREPREEADEADDGRAA